MESLCSGGEAKEEEEDKEEEEEEEEEEENVAKLRMNADKREEDEKQQQPTAAVRAPRFSSALPETATQKNQARRDALVGGEKATFKWCTYCRVGLSVSCFTKHGAGIFGLQSHCTECRNRLKAISRKRQRENEEAADETETEIEGGEEEEQQHQHRYIQPSTAMRAPQLSSVPLQTATQKNQARRDALVGEDKATF
jgi:hypothetical protein